MVNWIAFMKFYARMALSASKRRWKVTQIEKNWKPYEKLVSFLIFSLFRREIFVLEQNGIK